MSAPTLDPIKAWNASDATTSREMLRARGRALVDALEAAQRECDSYLYRMNNAETQAKAWADTIAYQREKHEAERAAHADTRRALERIVAADDQADWYYQDIARAALAALGSGETPPPARDDAREQLAYHHAHLDDRIAHDGACKVCLAGMAPEETEP